MRAVIQRVSQGSVIIQGQRVAEIGLGLVILLGIGAGDDAEKARALARKVAALRIFEDAQEKMNLSLLDVKGAAIVVSQFTLYADTRKGNRPSFIEAAPPATAEPLCDQFAQFLAEQGVPVQTGEFGAMMEVELVNDGPVTIVMEM